MGDIGYMTFKKISFEIARFIIKGTRRTFNQNIGNNGILWYKFLTMMSQVTEIRTILADHEFLI